MRKGQVMKRFSALLAVAAAMAVVPAVANASSVSPEKVSPGRWAPMPTRPETWRPMPSRPTRWSAAWKFEIAQSPATIVAPVHRLQWKTARNVAVAPRLVLQSAR